MTPQQHAVFSFIERYISDHGYSPAYLEIAQGIGLASKSAVHASIARLADRGYIRFRPGIRRSIEILRRPSVPAFIPPGSRVPELHVEIVRYRGKNGGFATQMVEMWMPRLVSPDGRRHRLATGLYGGHTEYPRAHSEAAWWAEFLGDVPIHHRTGPATLAGGEPNDEDLMPDEPPR